MGRDLLDDALGALWLAAHASTESAIRLNDSELAGLDALVNLKLVVLLPENLLIDRDVRHACPGYPRSCLVCTLPMMSPMTDEVVRSAVVDCLLESLSIDDLEDLAFERLVPGQPSLADSVLHIVSTREQYTESELREVLLEVASTVNIRTRDASDSVGEFAASAEIIDLRSHRERRLEHFTELAGTRRDRALG